MKEEMWEYKEVNAWEECKKHAYPGGYDELILNSYGSKGWELVCIKGKWNPSTGETPTYLMKRKVRQEELNIIGLKEWCLNCVKKEWFPYG